MNIVKRRYEESTFKLNELTSFWHVNLGPRQEYEGMRMARGRFEELSGGRCSVVYHYDHAVAAYSVDHETMGGKRGVMQLSEGGWNVE